MLSTSLCILETTGCYELEVLLALCHQNIAVHKANTRQVKHFIRSYGTQAKTDNLDAKALAKYGYERQGHLKCFEPLPASSIQLLNLMQRRLDLKATIVAEKNRLQAPSACAAVKASCQELIAYLKQEILSITTQIQALIDLNPIFKEKMDLLKTIPGIADITAFSLLILLPELGQLDRRQIASLAGLAPIARESGQYKGYRKTGHGRKDVKPVLFMAAMSARKSNSPLKILYENMIARGKKKMVVLTALMRKLLVIANAKIKSLSLI